VKQHKKRLIAIIISSLLISPLAIPAQAQTSDVEVSMEVIEPTAPLANETIRFAGSIKNSSTNNLVSLRLQLLVSDPILNRSELNQELTNTNTTRLKKTGLLYGTKNLAPGEATSFSIGINAGGLFNKGAGAYLVGFEVLSGDISVGTGFSVVPYLPDRASVKPLGLTLLWPVTAPPLQNGDGILLDETIPKSMFANGRLTNILNGGKSFGVTWLLDPNLLHLAEKSSRGYLVSLTDKNVDGAYSNEISTWFNDLRTTVASSERYSMTYANADLAAFQRNNAPSAFEQAVTIAKSETESKLGFTVGGTVLFQDKYPVSAQTIGLANSLGTNLVVLPETALPPVVGTTFNPSGTTTVVTPNGRVKVFLTDTLLSQAALNVVENAKQTSLQRQRLLSDSLLLALQLPNIERNIVVSPPAYWEPTNEGASVFAEALTRAPWLTKVEAWNLLTKDVSEIQRDNFLETTDSKAAELTKDQITRIKRGQSLLAQVTGLFQTPGVVSTDYATAILRAGSQYWQNAPSQARDFIISINKTLEESRNKVRILAGSSVVIPSTEGPIPITIANDFAEPVIVTLVATGNPAVRFKAQTLEPITIAPNSKQSLSFTGSVQGSGAVEVSLQLFTRDGMKYGEPTIISVRSAAYSTVASWITGIAFLILLLLSALSIYRRVKKARYINV